jgi:predicted membrane protein
MKKCNPSGRKGLGIVLLLAGAVILAGNLNLIPYHIYDAIISWPMILVAIALINFFRKEWGTGLVFLAVGTYFLLPKIVPDLYIENIWKFWPVLLILAGLAFILGRSRTHFNIEVTANTEDTIDEVSVFGGSTTRVDSKNFKGGKITSIFGGSEVNLTDARLSDKGAVIDLAAIFGGSKIIVPRDWSVKNEVVSILGGFTDKRISSPESVNPSKTLLIKGVAIFGGGELISY